jgi:hypothetical protein
MSEYKTDGRLPEVCCGNCPFAFPLEGAPKDYPEVACHRRPPDSHPIPVPQQRVLAPGHQNGGVGVGWIATFTSMRKTLVCGEHPLFNQHPNMVQFNEDQAAKNGWGKPEKETA